MQATESPYRYRRQQQVEQVIKSYSTWPTPFASHLTASMRQMREAGSKDRAEIRELCYLWLKLRPLFAKQPFEAVFGHAWQLLALDGDERPKYVEALLPEDGLEWFPGRAHVSPEIDLKALYVASFLRNRIWLLVKPGHEGEVAEDLAAQNVAYTEHLPQTWYTFQRTDLTKFSTFKKGLFRIQDPHTHIAAQQAPAANGQHWWDCCCGAGGKSITLAEKADIFLYGSDVRESIRSEYSRRMRQYNMPNVKSAVADVAVDKPWEHLSFDGIVADMPCTGSGTWHTAPENFRLFDTARIGSYAAKQRAILDNVAPRLKKEGTLLYITCSIYQPENEAQIEEFLKANPGFGLLSSQYLKGWPIAADTIYFALLKKP